MDCIRYAISKTSSFDSFTLRIFFLDPGWTFASRIKTYSQTEKIDPGPPHRVRNISCKSETWIPLQKSQGLPFRAEENCLLSHSPLKPRIRSTNLGSTSGESQNISRKHPTQSSTMDHKQPQETSQCDRNVRVPSTRHPRRKKAPSKSRAPVQDPSW